MERESCETNARSRTRVLGSARERPARLGWRIAPYPVGEVDLPCSSARLESLIKQFNQRIKGSEKFWVDDRAEAVLQVRTAYLSDDDRRTGIYDRCGARARDVGSGRPKAVA